jgi:D-glycero-D-manno-heptose 1,7-bisphosphate phosphatase
MRPRLYIFDADETLRSTLIAGQPCPHGSAQWALIPGVRERLRRFHWGTEGPFLGVASNQDHVGYGLLSASMARRLLVDMIAAAVGRVVPSPCIRFCPHPAEKACQCRKPKPGMLLDIMRHFSIGPSATVFVGDAQSDRQAAARAGVPFMDARDFFAR